MIFVYKNLGEKTTLQIDDIIQCNLEDDEIATEAEAAEKARCGEGHHWRTAGQKRSFGVDPRRGSLPSMTEPLGFPAAAAPLCAYCGAPVPATWFGLEVQQPRPRVPGDSSAADWRLLDGVFCRQEHAALWLSVALPPPEPRARPRKVVGPNWREHISLAPRVAGAYIMFGLAVIGGVAVFRYIQSMGRL